jgi:hypothetical protein
MFARLARKWLPRLCACAATVDAYEAAARQRHRNEVRAIGGAGSTRQLRVSGGHAEKLHALESIGWSADKVRMDTAFRRKGWFDVITDAAYQMASVVVFKP